MRIDCGSTDQMALQRVGPRLTIDIGIDPGYKPGPEARLELLGKGIPALLDTSQPFNYIDNEFAKSIGLAIEHSQHIINWPGEAGKTFQLNQANSLGLPVYLAQVCYYDEQHPVWVCLLGIPDLAAVLPAHRTLANEGLPDESHDKVILGRDFLHRGKLLYDGTTGKVLFEIDP